MNYDIYCDESRQDLLASPASVTRNNRYCCIGGVMISTDCRNRLKDRIKDLQKKYNVYGELKWGTVSDNKLPFYLELVNLFFDYDDLVFRTVVIDGSKINNKLYNNNDQELGYYKFYYQLLYHWIVPGNDYRVFTDQKTNGDKRRLKQLQLILNNSFYHSRPLSDIQAIDSAESLIMQLQNIIMGAVCYKYNWGEDGKSNAKKQIVRSVEQRLGHKISRTFSSERKFNVFEIALKEEF